MTSLVCPVDLDTRRLQEEVAGMYARVPADPSGEFHFHRGPDYAASWLGYDAAELASLPASLMCPSSTATKSCAFSDCIESQAITPARPRPAV